MRYQSSKTFGHDLGLSVCFRQPGAASHCRFLHGYALSFKFTFEATELDENNWVVDFGGRALKDLKAWLIDAFDHRLVVAADDPALDDFLYLQAVEVAKVIVMEKVGCEAFAALAFEMAGQLMQRHHPHVKVVSCEVREHGANGASVVGIEPFERVH